MTTHTMTLIFSEGCDLQKFLAAVEEAGIEMQWVEPATEDDDVGLYVVHGLEPKKRLKKVE